MVVVIHYDANREPDIWFGIDQRTEQKILNGFSKKKWTVKRAGPDEWYGQDDPNYRIHHYNATRNRG